jgi:formate-dependent nitrite reductase membrane component NrfD
MATTYERKWETRRSGGRSVTDEARTSYYGIPAIHKPHWKWLIIVYFFVGGIAGASYVIANIANLFGGAEARRITQAGRYISLAALIPSPILLILDLGRPERFYHMLWILKLRSPMSVGTWVLTIFSGFCGLSALIQAAEDGLLQRITFLNRLLLALPAKPIGALGSLFGFGMAGYTGILVAATAVPLWAKNYLLMGPLFLASAISNATAAITLVLSLVRGTSHDTLKRLERLDMITVLVELGLLLAARANLGKIIARPLREGRLGQIYRWGVLGMGISAPLMLLSVARLSGKLSPRLLAGLSSTLVLIGGFLFRYVMVIGGRASADDPQAYYEFTRKNKEQRTKHSE